MCMHVWKSCVVKHLTTGPLEQLHLHRPKNQPRLGMELKTTGCGAGGTTGAHTIAVVEYSQCSCEYLA